VTVRTIVEITATKLHVMAKTTIHVLTMNSNVGPHYVKTRNAFLMTRFVIRKRTVPMVPTNLYIVVLMNVPEFKTMAVIINA
jgi:hypothetical protein